MNGDRKEENVEKQFLCLSLICVYLRPSAADSGFSGGVVCGGHPG
jgi:hypothetical protein